MTKLPLIAFTALVAAAGLAAPAFAATSTSAVGTPKIVPACDAGNSIASIDAQRDALSTQLQLSTKAGSSIDMWGGCFQVTTHENGKTVVAYYDPDSLNLVARNET